MKIYHIRFSDAEQELADKFEETTGRRIQEVIHASAHEYMVAGLEKLSRALAGTKGKHETVFDKKQKKKAELYESYVKECTETYTDEVTGNLMGKIIHRDSKGNACGETLYNLTTIKQEIDAGTRYK